MNCRVAFQDNLLCRIEGQDQELAKGQDEEVCGKNSWIINQASLIFQCVVCGTNRASMQTLPCAHQVNFQTLSISFIKENVPIEKSQQYFL